ncbi:hypothetical protein [Sphingomonas sp.]|jgi:hypothetical protein|uniref:hypothetical protein n=1 Tax=Sphingomonas sp. TaxID=28214 RepID=UPI0035678FC1
MSNILDGGSNATVDAFSRQKVSIDANQTEVPYDDTNWATFVDQASSGSAPAASQADGQVTVSSGTGANGTRTVLSKDATKYRLGHEVGWGGTFKFDAAGIANADVWWGAADTTTLTNAVVFGWFNGTWGVRYRRGGSTIWTKTTADWIAGWETKYGETFDKSFDQIARIRAGLFGHRGFVVELASPVPNDDGSVRWIRIIDHTNINNSTVAVFTNNDLKLGMGVVKSGAGATNVSITSACQAGWAASDKARISDTLSDRTLASRVVAALVGRTNAGDWVGVNVNNQGRLFVTNDSVSATGAAAPTSATLTGGSDGTNLRAFATDASGIQKVRDDYALGEVLADQSGADAVLTFTFSAEVAGFWVAVVGDAGVCKLDHYGGTPSATSGIPVGPDAPSAVLPIPEPATAVKVYAPTGTTVTVWGHFR